VARWAEPLASIRSQDTVGGGLPEKVKGNLTTPPGCGCVMSDTLLVMTGGAENDKK